MTAPLSAAAPRRLDNLDAMLIGRYRGRGLTPRLVRWFCRRFVR